MNKTDIKELAKKVEDIEKLKYRIEGDFLCLHKRGTRKVEAIDYLDVYRERSDVQKRMQYVFEEGIKVLESSLELEARKIIESLEADIKSI